MSELTQRPCGAATAALALPADAADPYDAELTAAAYEVRAALRVLDARLDRCLATLGSILAEVQAARREARP